MGEHQDSGAHFVMIEEKRNILIGYVTFANLRQTSKLEPKRRCETRQTRDLHRVRYFLLYGKDTSGFGGW